MNEEEKKAVEFVKKRTKELKKYAKRENELVYDDIILNLIAKLQKENEELKNAVNIVNKEKSDWTRAYQEEKDKQFELLRSSIPVKEVKDKIEELKEQYNVRELDFIKTTQDIRNIIIQALEELIEGKKIRGGQAMTPEQAVNLLDDLSEYGLCYNITEEYQEAMKLVLSMLEEKDKIIGLYIDNIMIHQQVKTIRKMCCPSCPIGEKACTYSGIHRNCIKQYFENKAKEV